MAKRFLKKSSIKSESILSQFKDDKQIIYIDDILKHYDKLLQNEKKEYDTFVEKISLVDNKEKINKIYQAELEKINTSCSNKDKVKYTKVLETIFKKGYHCVYEHLVKNSKNEWVICWECPTFFEDELWAIINEKEYGGIL